MLRQQTEDGHAKGVVQLDLENIYGHVNWNFLIYLLQGYGLVKCEVGLLDCFLHLHRLLLCFSER